MSVLSFLPLPIAAKKADMVYPGSDSNYNTSGIFAFFIAGCAATNQTDRSVLHRRLDSTWNSPPGNVDNLRSIMEETWDRYDTARETGVGIPASWKEIAAERDWTLLLM